jgi:CheY-like chemotaxis protein
MLIGRVLRNLLENAVKYTSSGSVTVRVTEQRTDYCVEVIDTGSGIPVDQQARIFEEYVQLGNPARQRRHGVGLGLAIVRRIDSLLGLHLTLESMLGAGSHFSFHVPVAPQAEFVAISEPAVVDQSTFRTSATVWVVDDDPLVVDSLREQLTVWGADVRIYSRPTELMDDLGSGISAPDCVVADDMLGTAMSGLEMAEILATKFRIRHVCILTGNTEPQRLEALRRSAFPIIVKPAKPEALIAVVSQCVPLTDA